MEHWNNGMMGYKLNSWLRFEARCDVLVGDKKSLNPIFQYSIFPIFQEVVCFKKLLILQ